MTANTEGFETGDFTRFPWRHEGDEDWIVTSDRAHSGNYSAQAGPIRGSRTSLLKVTQNCADGEIRFYVKVSCEETYDYLRFEIDGRLMDEWSGEVDWTEVSFPVEEDRHTFRWYYCKDESFSEGADTAWIDDVVFPLP